MQSELQSADRLAQAAIFASQKHLGTRDDGKTPYAVHVFRVVEYLRTIGNERNPDVLCAGYLHDTIEDCGVTFDNIAQQFGVEVASIVAEVSNDNRLPKKERREAMLRHMPEISAEAKRLKLADRLDNVSDLLRGYGSAEKRRRYVEETRRILEACRHACAPLESALHTALSELTRTVENE